MSDLLCNKAEAGLAVPGVLFYEPNFCAGSVDEDWRDILSTWTCSTNNASGHPNCSPDHLQSVLMICS